ncbi:hypothetical protein MPSEU_000945300 [Mayamaea pseudoterrestris]|nr:hypothetical protein MPSEU_000945300 [Mayamaea pseudoterrestris]
MSWFSSFNNSHHDEEAAMAYQSANHDNIPVAHAVVMAPSDSQDHARPPPMNPSLAQPYRATAEVASSNPGPFASALDSPKQPSQQPVKGKVITTRTYTIPAGAPSPHPPTNQYMPQQTATSANLIEFTRNPQVLAQCPQCSAWNARTRVRTYPNWMTWVSCVLLVFIFWPLCWIPLAVDALKKTDHYCLACGKLVGSVPPFRNMCVKSSV